MVQLLALYTDPDSQHAQRYRRTDDMIMPIADHSYCVRSTKIVQLLLRFLKASFQIVQTSL